jgi:hypothetical protein
LTHARSTREIPRHGSNLDENTGSVLSENQHCDIWKPLDEDLALATSVIAAEAPNSDHDHHGATLPWKIGELAIVSAVDPL